MSNKFTPAPTTANSCTQSPAPVFRCVSTTEFPVYYKRYKSNDVKLCNASFFLLCSFRRRKIAYGYHPLPAAKQQQEDLHLPTEHNTINTSYHLPVVTGVNTSCFMRKLVRKSSMLAILLMVSLFFVSAAIGQTTYTWNQAGSGTWTTSTNWTPTRTTPATNDILVINNGGSKTISDVPTQTIGKLQISGNTTVILRPSTGTSSTLTVNTATTDALTVALGSTLTIAGRDATTDRTLTLTTANTAGLQANIDGTIGVALDNSQATAFGTFTKGGANATININSNATYNHAVNGGSFPTATWNANSTINITGITGTTPAGLEGQTFGHFIWNCNQSGTINLDASYTVAGNMTITAIGGEELRLNNSTTARTITVNGNFEFNAPSGDIFVVLDGSGACTFNILGNLTKNGTGTLSVVSDSGAGTVDVGGNLSVTNGTFVLKEDAGNAILSIDGSFIQSAGTFTFRNTGAGTANMTVLNNFSLSGVAAFNMTTSGVASLDINGNYSITGGTHNMTNGTSGNNSNGTMNVAGNFSQTGGTITETNTGNASIIFDGAGSQTYTSGGTLANTINFTVNSASTLQMGTGAAPAIISNGSNGSFTLQSGATLGVTSAGGISTSGTTGNIQVGGTRTYTAGANYIYNGAVNQVTGNGLSQATGGNLTIANTGGGGNNTVSLTAATSISGNLTLTQGVLDVSASNFALNIGGSWNNNVSTAAFNPQSGTVTFNGFTQPINGSAATNFHNLTLATGGTKIFGFSTSINGLLAINTGVAANLGTFTHSANTLTLGGAGTLPGSWGSSSSAATHQNDIYFAPTTGIINVAASSCDVTITPGTIPGICIGATTFTIPYTATGNPNQYSISGAGIVTVTNDPLTASPITVTLSSPAAVAGSINFTLTVTNSASGCVSPDFNGSVTVSDAPTSTDGIQTICSGTASGFTLSGQITNSVPSNFSWIAADNPNVTGESLTPQSGPTITNTLINTTNTPQIVVYTVTPSSVAGNCTGATFTVTITVNEAPLSTNGTQTICTSTITPSGFDLNSQITNGVPVISPGRPQII